METPRPVRIQRRRVKGFRLQEESRKLNGLAAVVVSRPSRWGNPYKVGDMERDGALAEYTIWLERRLREDPGFLKPLVGRNLCCWCRPGVRCHADLLLKFLELHPGGQVS